MRLRFVTDLEGNVIQYVADKEERDIEFYDSSDYTMEEAELKMREWTETPFEREDFPLNKLVMIVTPDNYKGIYLLVDHMTMDAQSLIVFLKDIIELYCYKRYEGMEYPKEMYSYIKQIEKDLAYEADSKAQYRDREYFKNLIEESEPIYNDIDGIERLLEERHIRGNNNIRNVTNVSNNVDANITVFSLEEYPIKMMFL